MALPGEYIVICQKIHFQKSLKSVDNPLNRDHSLNFDNLFVNHDIHINIVNVCSYTRFRAGERGGNVSRRPPWPV